MGSLVSDFHRNLLYGGIYLYPKDKRSTTGKLRLLYECAPLSFVVEQAGGLGSTGEVNVLDIEPTDVHERIPLISDVNGDKLPDIVIGNKKDVRIAEDFIQGKRKQ